MAPTCVCTVILTNLLWMTATSSMAEAHLHLAVDRVREMCGDEPVPRESLCNVAGELQEAFMLVEWVVATADFPVTDPPKRVVREREVAVDWYPDPDPAMLRPGLLGLYEPSSRRVYLPQGLGDEPLRVRAAVLAHELSHASWYVEGLGAGLPPARACLENEKRAYAVGIATYERSAAVTGLDVTGREDRPPGQVDRYLAEELSLWRQLSGGGGLTTEALGDLANRFIFQNGYAERCSWVS